MVRNENIYENYKTIFNYNICGSSKQKPIKKAKVCQPTSCIRNSLPICPTSIFEFDLIVIQD